MRTPQRPWAASRIVLTIGLALAATVVALSVQQSLKQRDLAIASQQKSNELLARVLEAHVTTTFDTVGLSLATVANDLAPVVATTPDGRSTVLTTMLVSLPQLRSIAVLDLRGRVLASSDPADNGRIVDVGRLGPLPAEGQDSIGRFIHGRGLAAVSVVPGERIAAPPPVGFIPLVRRARHGDTEFLVVGLVHPEGLAIHMRLTLDDPSSRAALVGYDGRLYTDTGDAVPGTLLDTHPVFGAYLPRIEHANYQAAGIDPQVQTGAFRVSSSRPLVVIVERPLAAVEAEWWDESRFRVLIVLLAVVTVSVLSIVAARGLAARESARGRLDRLQTRIARSEQELNVIVRSVQEFLFRLDANGVITFINAHWLAASGESESSIVGTRFEDLVSPAERAQVRAMLAPSDSSSVRTATVTFWAARGKAHRVDVALVPLRDGACASGFAGSAVDITEREEAQAQLAEQLAFVALLQDMSPLPASMRDMDGYYVDVNRAWQAFTGLSRDEVIGLHPERYLDDHEARTHEAKDNELKAAGGRLEYETSYAHPDGSLRDLLITKVLVPGRDGRPQGILSTFMDVTALRNASRATQEAREAAEEASRAKSEFIANISHELRTPLQSIIGFSELGTSRGHNDPLVLGMFTDILASGQRMLALVNDLLDVSKIESAVGTIHLERTDLRPLLRAVVKELAPQLNAKHLAIETRLPTTALSTRVDPFRFQQVVRNMLANAIRFSPVGERIVLEAAIVLGGFFHITVRDHGPGIPPGEFEDIFDAFVQSSKTKDGSGGTGLGLAICRKIIDAHGGDVYAENAEDGGARFHIVLPPNESETVPGSLALLHD
ncbi:sensor histidine kinase [Variovorax arabinosiphilus]|uniref:sensor histidine kinase n=1 Tax=Variovorax arabinosiphilus TaxID=3053498 RepID=UPI0025790F07|nr:MULTISPECIES: ATP-binding protein [unclassified Variovorax]MDM0118638.1 PAS domain S-box protein [Variovorax sp. J2L1-78]MDM0129063.1 PAS domain S-box protein [Variovorax sp. J2L1-63]MDM0233150.1 PAS domain S-box protein [Variovorax sp. J2R1-6]